MIRRTPLSRSRKPLKRSRLKRPAETWRSASESDRAKLKAEQARVTGAEYRSVYLAGIFRAQGCDLCGRYRPPAQQHHVRTEGKGRRADASETVILCAYCHRKGHDQGFTDLLAAHGLPPDHLDLRAAEHAATATAAGYLPVELCEECGKWRSRKFMLWEIEEAGREPFTFADGGYPLITGIGTITRRICTACAPEGPP